MLLSKYKESLPLTNMRYISGWFESVLYLWVEDFLHTGEDEKNRVLYYSR